MRSQVSRLKNQLDALYKDMDITKDTSTNMYNNFRDGVKLLIGNKSSVGSVSSVVSRSGKKRPNELVRTESDVVSHLHYVVDKLHDENVILREENNYNNIHVAESRLLIGLLDEKSGPTRFSYSVRCEELSKQGNAWREDYQKLKKRHVELNANFKEVHESEKLYKNLLTNEKSTSQKLNAEIKVLFSQKAVIKYQFQQYKRNNLDVTGSLISLRDSYSDMSSIISNTSPSKQRRITQTTDANLEFMRKQQEKRKYELFFTTDLRFENRRYKATDVAGDGNCLFILFC